MIKEEFELFAGEQGYESGGDLFEDLGLNKNKYERYKTAVPIGRKDLQILSRELGTAEVQEFIRLGVGDRERYWKILEEF